MAGMGAPYYPEREWSDMLYQGLFAGQDSGKTYAGAARHLLYINAWPNSVNIIAAPDFTRLERATLAQWKEFLSTQGFYENEHYIHNVTLKKITYLWNGAVDYLCSLDNPASVRGIRACAVWLDEAGYTDFAAMKALQPRMTRPGFPHFFDATSTPSPIGKYHWAYEFFFPRHAAEEGYAKADIRNKIELDLEGDPSVDRCCAVRLKDTVGRGGRVIKGGIRICTFAETSENPHGGEEEYNELATLLGEDSPEFQTEARGRFVVPGGLTLSAWKSDVHALHRHQWPDPGTQDPNWHPDRVAMGGDFGVDHLAAWVVWAVGLNGREYILDEWALRDGSPEEMAEAGVKLAKRWAVTHVYTDHDPTWFRTIREAMWGIGVNMYRANKVVGRPSDPSGGIGMINAQLRKRFPDGTPALIVDRDRCPGLIREVENYHRKTDEHDDKPTSERPVHVGDDRLDAGRYVRTAMALKLHWVGTQRAESGMVVVKSQLVGVA